MLFGLKTKTRITGYNNNASNFSLGAKMLICPFIFCSSKEVTIFPSQTILWTFPWVKDGVFLNRVLEKPRRAENSRNNALTREWCQFCKRKVQRAIVVGVRRGPPRPRDHSLYASHVMSGSVRAFFMCQQPLVYIVAEQVAARR